MSNEFVGFAKSPKAAQGSQKLSRLIQFETGSDLARCLQVLLTKGGLESWLGPISKFDERIGGKISYVLNDLNFGASYTLVTIPKRVILIAESFGEFDFRLKKQKSGSLVELSVTASLLPEEIAGWESLLAATELKLRFAFDV